MHKNLSIWRLITESQLSIDPDPEPPSYKIHQEKRGKHIVWVVTRNSRLIIILSKKNRPKLGLPPSELPA